MINCSDESLKIKTKRRKASAISKGELKMYKLTRLSWCDMWAVLHLNSTGGWEYVLKYADKETAEKLYNELRED